MSKRYLFNIGSGSTMNGVMFAGPKTYETRLVSGAWIKTAGENPHEARDKQAKVAASLGQRLDGPTQEV